MKKIALIALLITSFVFWGNMAFSQELKQAAEPDFSPYMKNLQKEIKANWNPPKSNTSKSVTTLFKVNKNGALQSVRVFKSSGDNEFDSAAILAITKTAPFSPLPQSYSGSSIDIQFTHDYNVSGQPVYRKASDNIINLTLNYTKPGTQDYINYVQQIDSILAYNSYKKTYIKRKSLEANIVIDKTGKIQSLILTKSSKDKKYDKLVFDYINKCTFPEFPKEIGKESISLNYRILSPVASASTPLSNDRLYSTNLLFLSSLLLLHMGHCH